MLFEIPIRTNHKPFVIIRLPDLEHEILLDGGVFRYRFVHCSGVESLQKRRQNVIAILETGDFATIILPVQEEVN